MKSSAPTRIAISGVFRTVRPTAKLDTTVRNVSGAADFRLGSPDVNSTANVMVS